MYRVIIDNQEFNVSKINIEDDIENLNYVNICDNQKIIDTEFTITASMIHSDYKALKKLWKLPRKLKKKFGTVKARKRLIKRIKLNLPLTVKDFKRSGFDLLKGD